MQTLEQLEQQLLDLTISLKDSNSQMVTSQLYANKHERLRRYLRDPYAIGLLNQNITSWRSDCEENKNGCVKLEQQINETKIKIAQFKENQNSSTQPHTERLRM